MVGFDNSGCPWRYVLRIISFIIVLSFASLAWSQESDDQGWPRLFEPYGHQVVVFQPQISEWKNYELIKGTLAVAVTLKGEKEPFYGAVYLEADTDADYVRRQVRLTGLRATDIKFPNVDSAKAAQCRLAVGGIVSTKSSFVVSLDRILAQLERAKHQQREVTVNYAPPPIHYSDSPAVLVIFFGEAKFQPVTGTQLLFAANTNWDIFLDIKTSKYYMLNGESWLTTKDVMKGAWTPATTLPADLYKLPKDKNWEAVNKNLPGKRASAVPEIIVTEQPSELVVTEGPPQLSVIGGTSLLYVSNTDSDLFIHVGPSGGNYYLLVAGRWFRSPKLNGPWTAATKDLPADFAKIPEGHPRARVLASVSGTDEADAAVLLASIPKTATVKRSELKITVEYEGTPEFVLIKETTVSYAVNSPYSVFRLDGRYYCCHQAVWFISNAPNGPWVVATEIPAALYKIPSTHPKHNVTYVYVVDSTPDTVVVSHSSGYTGQYVAAGLVMFGLGYAIGHDDDHWHHHHYHYHSHWYSYGCGARYDYYHGGYYRSARYYGPYGGAGAGARYNPSTGTYSRGAYAYGPRGGSAYAREAYNPYTGNYAGRVTASNPYGSWGRSVVSNGNDWVRTGHRSNSQGTVVGAQTSRGGGIVAGENRWGKSGFVAKGQDGNVLVGKDGNIYRRDQNGQWQSRSNNKWNDSGRFDTQANIDRSRLNNSNSQSVDRSKFNSANRPTFDRSKINSTRSPSSVNRATNPGNSRSSGGLFGNLNKQSRSRSVGNSRSSGFKKFSGRSSGGIRGRR